MATIGIRKFNSPIRRLEELCEAVEMERWRAVRPRQAKAFSLQPG